VSMILGEKMQESMLPRQSLGAQEFHQFHDIFAGGLVQLFIHRVMLNGGEMAQSGFILLRRLYLLMRIPVVPIHDYSPADTHLTLYCLLQNQRAITLSESRMKWRIIC